MVGRSCPTGWGNCSLHLSALHEIITGGRICVHLIQNVKVSYSDLLKEISLCLQRQNIFSLPNEAVWDLNIKRSADMDFSMARAALNKWEQGCFFFFIYLPFWPRLLFHVSHLTQQFCIYSNKHIYMTVNLSDTVVFFVFVDRDYQKVIISLSDKWLRFQCSIATTLGCLQMGLPVHGFSMIRHWLLQMGRKQSCS